jgi:uncharacterized membrane protein
MPQFMPFYNDHLLFGKSVINSKLTDYKMNHKCYLSNMEPSKNNADKRILSIDILRGIIMIIMALDHVRDFYGHASFDPLDLSQTSPLLFLTRWITHFCAPGFIFLSGVSAFLSSKRKTKNEAALFLFKRGLWLLLLEFTLIGFGWLLDIGFHTLFAQVIWAIGCSMIFLSALIYFNLKPLYIGIVGLTLIFVHNAFDQVRSDSFGDAKLLWLVVHEQGFYQLNSYESIFILYPLVPWIGVIAAGYYFGTLFLLEPAARRTLFFKIGAGAILLFIIFRAINVYGDPFPWQVQNSWWKNILAFIKCHKYPPSLCYLLMTIGVSIIALGFLEHAKGKLSRVFLIYGRVPFFYYILHIYLIHLSQVAIALSMGFTANDLENAFQGSPGKWGFELPYVYLIWITIVALLYFPCRWFMKIKERRRDWWLSYL